MTMTSQTNLAMHLDRHLRPYNVIIPFLLSIVVACAVAAVTLWEEARETELVIASLSGHLASLVEIQDGPEIQRLLDSIKQQRPLEFFLVQDGIVIGSTRSPSDLRRPAPVFAGWRLTKNISINSGTLQMTSPVHRDAGPNLDSDLIAWFSFARARSFALFAWAAVFLVGVLINNGYLILMRRALMLALKPLGALNDFIAELGGANTPHPIPAFGIAELDQIRQTVYRTQSDLTATREKLASARAREMAADSYRRLIHDLHTPVACLNSLSALANENPDDELIQQDAKVRIPKLASQILGQLSAASKNAEFEEPQFVKEDIHSSIHDAKEQVAFVAAVSSKHAMVEANIPDEPTLVPHDRVLLTRAVANLLKNAVEAGAKLIVVSVVREKDEAVLRVEDDGPGLSDDSDVTLFLSGRGRSTKRDRFAIGLSTVNYVATRHGSKLIYHRSKLGGACFEMRFQRNLLLIDPEVRRNA